MVPQQHRDARQMTTPAVSCGRDEDQGMPQGGQRFRSARSTRGCNQRWRMRRKRGISSK